MPGVTTTHPGILWARARHTMGVVVGDGLVSAVRADPGRPGLGRRACAPPTGVRGRRRQPTTPRAFSLVHTTVDGHGEHVGGVTRIMNLAGCQKGAQRERPSGGPRSTAGVQPLASAHYGVCAGAQWAICIYFQCE